MGAETRHPPRADNFVLVLPVPLVYLTDSGNHRVATMAYPDSDAPITRLNNIAHVKTSRSLGLIIITDYFVLGGD